MQCVTDFDFTLTKFWSSDQIDVTVEAQSSPSSSSLSTVVSATSQVDALPHRVRLHSWYTLSLRDTRFIHFCSHKVLEDCGLLSETYHERAQALQRHYYPLEVSPDLDMESKTRYMIEWVTQAHDLLRESNATRTIIHTATKRAIFEENLRLRGFAPELITLLDAYGVPILVFSAGIADIIETALEIVLPRVVPRLHVIANRCIFIEDVLTDFEQPLIHVFNKRAATYRNSSAFFAQDDLQNRRNLLLLGDSLGDVNMSDGLDFDCCIRIGFLNDREERLPEYLKNFDVVILGDSNLDYVFNLVKSIVAGS